MKRIPDALRQVVLVAVLTLAPSEVEPWRLDPSPPPARILPVGEPMPALWVRGAHHR